MDEEKEVTKRMPYATWEVDGVEYKLKLTSGAIVKLEEEFKTNIINLVANGGMPALTVMLKVTHGALQKYNHGMKYKDVIELFDTYCDEGGSQTSFLADVFMNIFEVSGFLSPTLAEDMQENMEEIKGQL